MIICEIECNFREYHKNNFFENFFLDKTQDEFSNDQNFEFFLEKFQKIEIKNLKVFTNFEDYQEIVEFFDGNLTVLFTKFEFLFQEVKEKGIKKMKSKFFNENFAFEFEEKVDYKLKKQNLKKKNQEIKFDYNFESNSNTFLIHLLFY